MRRSLRLVRVAFARWHRVCRLQRRIYERERECRERRRRALASVCVRSGQRRLRAAFTRLGRFAREGRRRTQQRQAATSLRLQVMVVVVVVAVLLLVVVAVVVVVVVLVVVVLVVVVELVVALNAVMGGRTERIGGRSTGLVVHGFSFSLFSFSFSFFIYVLMSKSFMRCCLVQRRYCASAGGCLPLSLSLSLSLSHTHTHTHSHTKALLRIGRGLLRRSRRAPFSRWRRITAAVSDYQRNRRDLRQNRVRALRRVVRRHLLQNARLAFQHLRHVCHARRHRERQARALQRQQSETEQERCQRLLRHVIGGAGWRRNRHNTRTALHLLRRHAQSKNRLWGMARALWQVACKQAARLRRQAMGRWREVLRERQASGKRRRGRLRKCKVRTPLLKKKR